MYRKELAYAITLAASLFSLSLLLFSQGATSLSVSLGEGQPFAVAIPTMFTMDKVLIMIVLSAFGAHSLTMLTSRLVTIPEVKSPLIAETVNGNKYHTYQEDDDPNKLSANDVIPEEAGVPDDIDFGDELVRVSPFNKTEHKKKVAADILQGEEKELYLIVCEKKEILQSELVLESGLSKVKVSRLLQKLERKSLLVRRPYGNTNKVMLAE